MTFRAHEASAPRSELLVLAHALEQNVGARDEQQVLRQLQLQALAQTCALSLQEQEQEPEADCSPWEQQTPF